jgi:hypothetical protein
MASHDTEDDQHETSSKEGDKEGEKEKVEQEQKDGNEDEAKDGNDDEAIDDVDDADDGDLSSSGSSEPPDEAYLPPKEEKSKKRKAVGSARLSVTLGTNFDDELDATNETGVVDLDESEAGSTNVTHLYKVLLDSSTAETKAVFDTWQPTVAFQWLACRFAKKVKRGFFTHSWDIVRI